MAAIPKSISLTVCVGFVLLAGFGCGPDPSLAGKWDGYRDWKKLEYSDQRIAIEVSHLQVSLEEGGRFLINDGGLLYEGSWNRNGENISLSVDTLMNQKIGKQSKPIQDLATSMRIKVDSGGNLRFFDEGQSSGGVLLKRVPKPH